MVRRLPGGTHLWPSLQPLSQTHQLIACALNHRLADLLGVEVPQSVPKGTLQALIERPSTVTTTESTVATGEPAAPTVEEPAAPTMATEEPAAPLVATDEPAVTTVDAAGSSAPA